MSRVQNIETFQKSDLRKKALEIIESAYDAIDTERAIERSVRITKTTLYLGKTELPLNSIDKIIVIGAGKCSPLAACALEKILGKLISDGIIIGTKKKELCSMAMREGTHPFPSEINVSATNELLDLLHGLTNRDLVIALISGGGSTLLCNPKNMTCENEKEIVQKMFKNGATIEELNTIRKHISSARGGMLAYHAYPARVVSFIFSDVSGNDMSMVASGPTVMDTTTVQDAEKIIEKYKLKDFFPSESLTETVKDEKYFARVSNEILVSNDKALDAMKEVSERLGFATEIITDKLIGEAKEIGKKISEMIAIAPSRTAYFMGGEPTVTVTHEGYGGRELELVLSVVPYIKNDAIVVGFASDGRDNCDFAGAICDIITAQNAKEKRIDPSKYLVENASYKFFEMTGDFILTGETGENVSDLIFAIKK
jgi:glycerate-2-kinase